MLGKQFTDLTKASVLKDSDIFAVHDGNGLKKSSMGDVTAYMSDKFSNQNLLINPNFKINQRGETTYETSGEGQIYSVDRWRFERGKVTVNSDGTVTVTATGGTTNKEGYCQQQLENAISGAYTVSMEVISISGTVRIAIDGAWQNIKSGLNVFYGTTELGTVSLQLAIGSSITLKWVKLEQGPIATQFVAPNPAEELMKCQRYYYRSKAYKYGVVPDGKAWVVEILTQDFRTKPTLQISTTYESHINKKEQRVTSIGNKYVISLKLISTDNVLDAYALETEIKVDAEIY